MSDILVLFPSCPFCGQEGGTMTVDHDGYYAWRYGVKSIQSALPKLSADEREQLKTGICPACWDGMLG